MTSQCRTPTDFVDGEYGYYATLLHEMVHSSGNRGRLNFRGDLSIGRNTLDLATEELRAELGAVLMCAQLEIPYADHMDSHAGYCQHWMEVVDQDPQFLMQSIKDVVMSCNYLLNYKSEHKMILDSCNNDFQRHLVAMAIAGGKDVETSIEKLSMGEVLGNMHVSKHHGYHIALANSDNPVMPSMPEEYGDELDKSLLSSVKSAYHGKANKEAKSIMITLDGDLEYDPSMESVHDNDADYRVTNNPGL